MVCWVLWQNLWVLKARMTEPFIAARIDRIELIIYYVLLLCTSVKCITKVRI